MTYTDKLKEDTLIKTIEKKFGVDLGYRSDAQLHTFLKKEGVPSLSKLLKMTRKKPLTVNKNI